MAAKKAVVRKNIGPERGGKTDVDLVEEAYGDAMKNLAAVFIGNYTDGTSGAETKFLAGLKLTRKARERALELVRQ